MKNTSLAFVLLFLFHATSVDGQTITWAEHAAPIFYSNCVKCHNPNGVAPFELITYESALNRLDLIKHMVSERKMPPWTPDPHYRRLANERILRQGEIDTLVSWVESGGLVGDVTKAPATPTISNKTEIQNPDLTLQIPNFNVNTPSDVYRCFVLPYSIATDKFLTDVEIIPGNRTAVHHILLFHDNTSTPDSLDAKDAEAGYPCFGGTGSDESTLIGGWVPGQQAQHLPEGIGINLPKNAKAILQVHYPAGTTNELDSTKVLLKYTSTALRNLYTLPLLNHVNTLTNGPLFIPANTKKTFNAKFTTFFEGSLLQIAPHMHLIGKSIKVWGVTPSKDTIPLIYIPSWNFHWQGFYTYRNLLRIPNGTSLQSAAFYDNTHDNEHHPNHGQLTDVKAGEATTDEMMLVYFSFLEYKAGDETIPIPSTPLKPLAIESNEKDIFVSTAQFYALFPNPSFESTEASFYLPKSMTVRAEIVDSQGKRMTPEDLEQFMFMGHNTLRVSTKNLPNGHYFLSLYLNGQVKTKPFTKQ